MNSRQEQWLSARGTRNPVLETMRDTFDGGDAWGSVLAWRFAIADALTEIDPALVPASWEFEQSLFGPDTEAYEYQAICDLLKDEGIDADDLIRAGDILIRYAKQLDMAGRSY